MDQNRQKQDLGKSLLETLWSVLLGGPHHPHPFAAYGRGSLTPSFAPGRAALRR